ncbi:hypothetical protein RN001_014959 [Aquatica leii]|uniref:Luciferase n=1 Tax=Aquatica leii TaxID=1421715 RepID=A0AAN7PYZ4_9COLE|nr:hypothetical protein RN001_014959 [Aquatica leii]
MKKKGLKAGDYISICAYQNLNNCVPQIASYFIGVIPACIDPSLSVKESVYLLNKVGPKMIFTSVETIEMVEKIVDNLGKSIEIVVFGNSAKHTPFDEFLVAHDEEIVFTPREPKSLDETVVVIFSSGTTGLPKALCYSHRTMLSNMDLSIELETIGYCTASQYWVVYMTHLQACIAMGCTRLVLPYFEKKNPWNLFKHNIDYAGLTATCAIALINKEKPKDINNELLVLFVWGASLPLRLKNQIRSCFPNTIVLFSYGLTEVLNSTLDFPILTALSYIPTHPDSVGTVKRGISYKVVDPFTEEILGPNQRGELRVKAKSQFTGYLDQDSSNAFDSDGWLKSGDIVYYDEDLCFYVVDRIKENFKYTSHYITPVELEDVLLSHSSVEAAAVIGKPHEVDGNHAMGVVLLKESARGVTATDIEKFVEERVEDKKRLRGGVKIVTQFPMTVSGKINRFKLKQMVCAKMMQAVQYNIKDNVIYTSDTYGQADPKGLGHFFYNKMLEHQNKVAQVDGYTKEEDTYKSLLKRSVRTALTMLDKGLKPGDHISLCTYHHFNSAVPHIASYFTGIIMGAIDPVMSAKEAAYLLKQTLPKMIFVTSSAVTLVEEVIELIGIKSEIVVFGDTTQHTPFSEFIRPHKDEDTFKPREVENLKELALILFSSGSSGMPKGICHSHFNMLCFTNIRLFESAYVLYMVANAYWNAFPEYLQISIEYGCKRVIYPSFNVDDVWALYRQPIDFAFLNPMQALQMVRSRKPESVNLKNVKLLYIGGNSISVKQMKEIKSGLPHTLVYNGYSQSEVFEGLLYFKPTFADLQLSNKNLSSVGTIMNGRHYKVVDVDSKKVLGPNEVGELCVKTPSRFIGYLNQDSTDCFDSEGWLKTGDLFYYNEDLCFFIVDRIKESFKFQNQHIFPNEIEHVILNLEPVDKASNHPMAIIKLKPEATQISAEEIIKHVEDTLEDKKRLRGGVKFVENLPMTVNGKETCQNAALVIIEEDDDDQPQSNLDDLPILEYLPIENDDDD